MSSRTRHATPAPQKRSPAPGELWLASFAAGYDETGGDAVSAFALADAAVPAAGGAPAMYEKAIALLNLVEGE
jgi:hypothetical protein